MLSDEMHDGLFQHRGGQAPAGEVLLATVLDEAPGDVVAEPLPVFLFGVARRQPVPGLVMNYRMLTLKWAFAFLLLVLWTMTC